MLYGREFRYTEYGRPHCLACDTDNDICQFPMAYEQPPQAQHPSPRLRLGQQGSVQLCEHVHIAWASITTHIEDWRRRQQQQHEEVGKVVEVEGAAEDNWQACLDSFYIECHDPTHDTRCTASEAPTWPRARLGTSSGFWYHDPDIVVLFLEWKPHGRIDALTPTTDGRIPAPELRRSSEDFGGWGQPTHCTLQAVRRLYPRWFVLPLHSLCITRWRNRRRRRLLKTHPHYQHHSHHPLRASGIYRFFAKA